MKKYSRITAVLLAAGMVTSVSFTGYGYEENYTDAYAADAFADAEVYEETDLYGDDAYDVYGSDQSIYGETGADDTGAGDVSYTYEDTYADTYTESYVYDETAAGYEDAADDYVSFVADTETDEESDDDVVAVLSTDYDNSLGYRNGNDMRFPENWPIAPAVSCGSAYILDAATGTAIYSKNSNTAIEISGPAKIMTALIVLEQCALNDPVKVTATGATNIYSDAASTIPLTEGETVTVEDCLHGILLASANNAAEQLAEQIGGGSIDKFVDLMNAKAAELGCNNTLFTNPTGLPDEDLSRGSQHTTARDMAVITRAAFENPDFRRIASTVTYTIPSKDNQSPRSFSNNFSLATPNTYFYYDGCLGGREGYTSSAALNVATAVEHNGETYIVVALNGADTEQDVANLFAYVTNSFNTVQVEKPEAVIEGGIALLPTSANIDDLTVTTSQKIDGTHRDYYFGNLLVGYSVLPVAVKENRPDPTPTPAINHEENMREAQEITTAKSTTPYYIIGTVSAILIILLLVALVRVIIAKEK